MPRMDPMEQPAGADTLVSAVSCTTCSARTYLGKVRPEVLHAEPRTMPSQGTDELEASCLKLTLQQGTGSLGRPAAAFPLAS